MQKKHPDAIGKVVKGVGSVVGFFIPAIGVASNAVPDKIVPKVVEVAGMLTPEHLANVLIKKHIKKKKDSERAILEESSENIIDNAEIGETVETVEEECVIAEYSGDN